MNIDLDSKKGILLLGNFLSQARGTRGVLEDVAEQLRDYGWYVTSASNSPNRVNRLKDIIAAILLERNRYQVAIIEVYSGIAFIWAEIACSILRAINKRYIITLQGGKLPEFSLRWPGRVKKMIALASVVATPSKQIQSFFSPWRTDIQYIPNAISISRYPFHLRSSASPKLCWLRAFHNIYNPSLAVDVTAKLSAQFSNIRLMMIGPDKKDGSFDKTIRSADQYQIRSNINIIGAVSKYDIPDYLNQSDIFLNTTRYESFGIAVLEAAAVGLCIVSTNVGELPYLWEDGVDALLVPTDDVEAMANALQSILLNPELAARLSYNARRKAELFDWINVYPAWEKLINRALGSDRV